MFRDTLKRMHTELNDVVHYTLDIHGFDHKMNDYIGKKILSLTFEKIKFLIY